MSLINTPPIIRKEDWNSAVEFSKKTIQALQQLAHLRLGVDSSPTFVSPTLTGLTASRLTATNSVKALTSVSDLTSWIAGTSNRVTVGDDGDGTVTLTTPQDTHTGASPTFANLSLGTGELTCGSVNRASGTLTLEIGGTAEISITSSAITLGGNLVIPDDGYIGSVSDTDALQINSTGNVAFTQIARGIFPVAGDDMATKEYVDLAIGSSFDLFLSDTDDAVVANTHVMYEMETGDAESTETNITPLGAGDDQLLVGLSWLSEAGSPGTDTLREGVYDCHVHLNKNVGGATTTVYWKLSYVDADGSSNKTLVTTSETTGEITTSEEMYDIHAVVASPVPTGVTKRLLFELYANIGQGQNVTIAATLEGDHDSHISFQVPSSIWQHHGDVLDDLNTLGVVASDGQFIVGTGAGTFAYESPATVLVTLSGQAGAAFDWNSQNLTSVGTIISGDITILDDTPILVFKDSNSLGSASVGFIEWRDSGGGRAGFLGNHSSGNDDLYWKNEQGGNIGIETTGAGELQIFANTVMSDTLTVEGASATVGKASTTTGTLVLHDSNSANTITLTVPDISAGSLTFTLPPTDGDNTNVLQTDGNGILTWVAAGGVSNHAILDGSVHTDSVADDVTRGSLIYGNSTPKWDELVKGAANTFLGSDGTDISYRTATQVKASLGLGTGDSPTFAAVSLGTGELTCGSVNRASGTLTLEIGDTAELSITSAKITLGGTLFIPEQAAAEADVAGQGQFWVKDDTPCTPWFVDDTGVEHTLHPGAITQTVNLLQSDNTAAKQAKIDAVPKYIPSGVTLTFQFETGGTHTETAALDFVGFWGGGTLNVNGNTSETAGLYNTQDTILDFTTNAVDGITVNNCTVGSMQIRNLKVMIKDSANVQGILVYQCQNNMFISFNYVLGAGITTIVYGIRAFSNPGMISVRKNYVSNMRYGVIASRTPLLYSDGNDDTGTQPQYGLYSNTGATIRKNGTQPAGSTANELTATGGTIE